MTDPKEIARKLTTAQAEALTTATRQWGNGLYRPTAPGVTRKALRDRGLGHGDWAYLTPLGLAVRKALLQDTPTSKASPHAG